MSFRLVPKLVTLNDLERRNVRYFALFHQIRVRCRRTFFSKSTFDSLWVYGHINTVCAIIQRLFEQKTNSGNSV